MTILRTVLILSLLTLLSRSGQAQVAAYPGAVAGDCQTTVAKDSASSTVTALAAASNTLIRVANTGAFSLCQIVSVGREQMLITAIGPTGLTVTRGYAGTNPATIYPGTFISGDINAWSFNALKAEIQAIETTLGPNMSNVPGVDPTTTRGDLFYRGASGPIRLPLGATGTFLKSNGTDAVYTVFAPVATTASVLRGDNAGNAVAVTGTASNCVHVDGSTGTCGGSASFDAITSGSNVTASMTVGSGASLVSTGTGVIDANKILGATLTSISGLVKMTSGVPSAALAADVVALFSGCSGTQYLGADGACHASGGGGAATSIATTTVGALPGTCSPGDVRFATNATIASGGFFIYNCTATNTWAQLGYVAGGSGALALSCTTAGCTIDVTSAVMLKAGTNVITGSLDASGGSKTAPFRIGSADPATCDNAVREFFFNTTTNLLKSCNTVNTWVSVGGRLSSQGYWSPFGLAQTVASLYSGDGPGAIIQTAFIPPMAMSISKVEIRIAAQPGSSKAIAIGIVDAETDALLGQARQVNPAIGNVVFTLGSTVTLSAGHLYAVQIAQEGSDVQPSVIGGTVPGYPLAFTSAKLHRVCTNATTGTNTTYSLPASCGAGVGNTYYQVVSYILEP